MPDPIPWSRAERRLRNAENYWLATTRPDGRPHAMPVYGMWHERAFWFGTGRASVKGRNLTANPNAVMHLESGDDVVIVEGSVQLIDDDAIVRAVTPHLAAKYGLAEEAMALNGDEAGGALYVLRPRVVHAWLEGAFLETRSRWTL